MFKWIKKLFVSNEATTEQEVKQQEQGLTPEQEEAMKEKAALLFEEMFGKITEEEPQKQEGLCESFYTISDRLFTEVLIELHTDVYSDRMRHSDINMLWQERIAPVSAELLEQKLNENPNTAIKDIVKSICVSFIEEHLGTMLINLRKHAVTAIADKFKDVFEAIDNQKELLAIFEKTMVSADDLILSKTSPAPEPEPEDYTEDDSEESLFEEYVEVEEELAEEEEVAVALQEEFVDTDKDDTDLSIDSFLSVYKADDCPRLHEDAATLSYQLGLSDYETEFLKIYEQHPEYHPLTIFKMIKRQSENK